MSKIIAPLFVVFGALLNSIIAQTVLNANGNWHTINYTGSYQDFLMPSSTSYSHIEFKLFGADGGDADNNNCTRAYGGQGAEVLATFTIGSGSAVSLSPNDKIRFVVGQKGEDCTDRDGGGGGGGGGSAIIDVTTNGAYQILAVAGAGGGALVSGSGLSCDLDSGKSASISTSGTADDNNHSNFKGGINGSGGQKDDLGVPQSDPGGGAFSDGTDQNGTTYNTSGKAGRWTGGAGGDSPNLDDMSANYGGWGFGGGGAGWTDDGDGYFSPASGGGGGYSGGAGANLGRRGGGGGSYALEGIYDTYIHIPGNTSTENGRIQYRFVNRMDCNPEIANVNVIEPSDCSQPARAEVNVTNNAGCNTDEVFFTLLKEDDDGFQIISKTGVFENLAKGNYQVNYNKYTREPIAWDTLDSKFFTVNVVGDTDYPTSKFKDITVYLDENGEVLVSTAELDDGTTDNCGVDRMHFAQAINGVTYTGPQIRYNCNNIGVQRPGIFVYDYAGNGIIAGASITVVDNLAPQAAAAFEIPNSLEFTVAIDSGVEVTITEDYLDIKRFFEDNCTDQSNLSVVFSELNRTLTCTDVGTTITRTAKVKDASGNESVGIPITINVVDKSAPTVDSCPSDITVNTRDDENTALAFYTVPSFRSSCGVAISGIRISGPDFFEEIGIGDHTVVYEATNPAGQKVECSFTITVEDNEAPTGACAEDGVLQTNARYRLSNYVTKDDWTDNSDDSSDLIITQTSGPAENSQVLADFTVEYTVEDTYGNKATCSFDVIVNDLPSVRTKNIDKTISYNGETIVLAPSEIDNGSSSDTSPVELLLEGNRFHLNISTDSPTDQLVGSSAWYYEPFVFMVPTTGQYTFTTEGDAGTNLVLWSAPIQENSGAFNSRPEFVDFVTIDNGGSTIVGNNVYNLEVGKLYYMSVTGLDPEDTFSGDIVIDKDIRGNLPVYRSLAFDCATTSSYQERLYVADSNGLTSSRNARIRSIGGVTNICDPFIVKFQTTSNNETITIPTTGSGYDYVVDWGDGMVDVNNTGGASHRYNTANAYTVKIYGDFPSIYFSGSESASKITEITQWGANEWTSMEGAFKGCTNLIISATDIPVLSSVNTLNGTFEDCTVLTTIPNLNTWDVSGVSSLQNTFNRAISFNADVSNWRVSNVTTMANVLNNTSFSWENYDALLINWSQLGLQENVAFSAGTTNYCVADEARQKIIDDFKWSITDGNQVCPQVTVPDIVGVTLEAATATLDDADLDVGTLQYMYSDTIAEGSVVRQETAANSQTNLRANIGLVISLGSSPLLISGVMDGNLSGTITNALELYVIRDIPDLSLFSIGVANEGGGSDGVELSLSGSASAGDFIYLSAQNGWFNNYYGFDPDYEVGFGARLFDGDDAVELFVDDLGTPRVIDAYGDVNQDGTGTAWDYSQRWVYRKPNSIPNGIFTLSEWRIPSVNIMLNTVTTNAEQPVSFPLGTYGQPYDSTPPVAICKDVTGHITEEDTTFSIDAADIDNGSYDSTGVVYRSISESTFNCLESGIQEVTLTVFDAAGNSSTCTSTITITVDPIEVVCKDYTAFLDYTGNTTVHYNEVFEKVNGPCFGEGAKWYISKTAPNDGSEDFSGAISDTNNTDDFLDDGNSAYYETTAFTVPQTKEYALNPSYVSSGGTDDYLFVVIYDAPVNPNSGVFASRSNLIGGYVYQNGGEFAGRLTGANDKLSLSTGTTYYAQFLFYNTNDASIPSTGTYTANFADEFVAPINTGGVENTDLPKTLSYTSADKGDNTAYVVVISDLGQIAYCETKVTIKEQEPFVTTWKTDNAGDSTDNQITIPTASGSTYDYAVDWGDGNTDNAVTGDITHTYPTAGTYTVSITGTFPRIHFSNRGDKNKLLTIEQWGEIKWQSMANAFYGCSNLNITNPSIDTPNLSNVTDLSGIFEECIAFNGDVTAWNTSTIKNMNYVFYNCSNFNQDIGNWNVDEVTTMELLFYNAEKFNQNIDGWNVANVTNMLGLFQEAQIFNQDLNSWNVVKVTDMSEMFSGASAFNGNITDWDTASLRSTNGMFIQASTFNQNIGRWKMGEVTDASYMFQEATAFNQDIKAWDVSKLQNMSGLFYHATAFNQDIGSWNTRQTTTMASMFEGATSFDQNIGDWDITNIIDNGSSGSGLRNMFKDAALSVENYDSTLIGWRRDTYSVSGTDDVPSNIVFNGGNSKFCLAEGTKQRLESTHGWTITDSGTKECDLYEPFVTVWKTDNPGVTGDNKIKFPYIAADTVIDWGDGIEEYRTTSFPQHTYATPGIYTVKVYGNINGIDFYNYEDPTDNKKLIEIQQWGSSKWQRLQSAFYQCSNLQITATDVPDFSEATDVNGLFWGCTSLGNTPALSNWKFYNLSSFNYLFTHSNFNGDISGWNVSNIRSMEYMFNGNAAFDQDLGDWDISKLRFAERMFSGTALSLENYDKILTGWSTLEAGESLQENVFLSVTGVNYCDGEAGRNILTSDPYNWTIDDGFLDCPLLDEDAFITVWKTDNAGVSNDTSITMPIFIQGGAVDWGDGTITKNVSRINLTHDYGIAGTYTVKIYGDIPLIDFYNFEEPTDNKKLIEIKQWGPNKWGRLQSAFYECSNLQIAATDVPDLSEATDVIGLFWGCSSIGSPSSLANWDFGNLTSLRFLFARTNFNSDISNWDVSNISNMEYMFSGNTSFNQDLGGWDVSSLRFAEDMFKGASAFTRENYDNTLIGWATLENDETLQSRVMIGAQQTTYCDAATLRQQLVDDYDWNIVDKGLDPNCSLSIAPKVILQGAFHNPNSGEEDLMRDDLRVAGYLPAISPYGDGATVDTSVFSTTGNDAIVDWVKVELRDASDRSKVVSSQSVLLQRDGDIVGLDGSSPLIFEEISGEYYIAINHRNHLGIQTAETVTLSMGVTRLNFTNNIDIIYNGNKAVSGLANNICAMICGDYDESGQVQNTDVNSASKRLGISGYNNADMDMNGQIQNTDINSLLIPNLGRGE